MNKTFRSFLLLLSSSFLLASCNGGSTPSSSLINEASIALSQTALTLETYEEATLSYTLTGKEGTPSWKSSDASIASVDSQGKVTGVKAGSCTITVSLDDLSASCEVTVTSISQAPRIVLGEPSVALDKGGTYAIDAYAVYKNEIRDDSLDVSLKGSDTTIASATYANKKITISGLEYGQADFVVHANILGVLVTANLHVQVVNANIALKLGNITPKDGEYSLELGMFKVDDDGLPTEFTPEVIFTDKEQPASYALTYTSSDDSIAAWDDSHKILAKGVGDATLSIACEQFKLFVEIKVNVVKGAYDVVLKNINEAGESTSEKIGAHKAPKTVAYVENKKFVGWFDGDGNKVDSIIEDVTLYAHYSAEFEYSGNEVLKRFANEDGDYSQPEGTDWKYAVRSDSDIKSDINNGYYPSVDGAQAFLYPNDMSKIAGLGLPAYDFSTGQTVRFTFGFSETASDVRLNGSKVGDCPSGKEAFYNYTATIRGKSATIENKGAGTSTVITLDDDTYSGRKGLEIKATGVAYSWLFLTPFKSIDVDYVSIAGAIEKSLPDEPEAGDYRDTIETYKKLRALFGEAEESIFPLSAKMSSWIDAYTATKALAFDDHGDSVYAGLTGNSSFNASTYVSKYEDNGYKDESRTDSLQFRLMGLDNTYFTLTLPKFDFSSHGKTSFKMEVGGGPGDKTFDYWLGTIPDTPATPTAAPTADLLGASNYIGVAPTGTQNNWDTGGTTVTISSGKITFSGLSSKTDDQTFDLDESVNNGTAGLAITIGWGSWNCLAISPFYASQL